MVPARMSLVLRNKKEPAAASGRCTPCGVEADAHPQPHRTKGGHFQRGPARKHQELVHGRAPRDGAGLGVLV